MAITFRSAPEYRSVEAFVAFCKEEYSHEDLQALGYRLRLRVADIRAALSLCGLSLANRPVSKHIRGFTTSSNDRWYGPGSSPCHGGSGFSNFE